MPFSIFIPINRSKIGIEAAAFGSNRREAGEIAPFPQFPMLCAIRRAVLAEHFDVVPVCHVSCIKPTGGILCRK
jgi:hypothetical protein